VGELKRACVVTSEATVYFRNNRPRRGMRMVFMHPSDDYRWALKLRLKTMEAEMLANIARRELARIGLSDSRQIEFAAPGFAEEPGLFDALAEVSHESAMDCLPGMSQSPGLSQPPVQAGLSSVDEEAQSVPESGTDDHIYDLNALSREQLNTIKWSSVPESGTVRGGRLTPQELREMMQRAFDAASRKDKEGEFIRLLRVMMGNSDHPIPCNCGRGMCKHGGFWRTAFRNERGPVIEMLQEMIARLGNVDFPIRNLGATMRDEFNRIQNGSGPRKQWGPHAPQQKEHNS
jgi:hypothetical protein